MYVVGNWKAQVSNQEARELALSVRQAVKETSTQVWVAPPSESIRDVYEVLSGSGILVGAQNVWPTKGAFTGELSSESLKAIGGSFAIVGHSERRHVFGETNELILKRANGALDSGLKVIFCVGETLEEREAGKTLTVIESQLEGVSDKVLIAYEPVWAIGTGKVASTKDIKEVHQFIYKQIKTEILYGGSVTPENFGDILKVPHTDGGLVGGASLKAQSFSQLVSLAK